MIAAVKMICLYTLDKESKLNRAQIQECNWISSNNHLNKHHARMFKKTPMISFVKFTRILWETKHLATSKNQMQLSSLMWIMGWQSKLWSRSKIMNNLIQNRSELFILLWITMLFIQLQNKLMNIWLLRRN